MRAGSQISNIVRAHRGWDRKRCREHALALLAEVGLSDPDRIYNAYPHQLSSGEKQRVAVAQAVACEPTIVIADEPTANLDTATEAQIVQLFQRMKARFGLGLLFITHKPTLLAGFADRVMVMYAGQIVEQGPAATVLRSPLHPYTAALLRCTPDESPGRSAKKSLRPIAGEAPDLATLPTACSFEPRCESRLSRCANCVPDVTEFTPDQSVRCFNPVGVA
jgi:oligopeptide/dipeptide ABC transporter ATP-binding protein